MTLHRSNEQKVADTATVFNALRDEITPAPFRNLINKMVEFPVTEGTDMAAYASLVQASMSIARIVAANDRQALLAAAIITQSGRVNIEATTEDPEA